VSGMWRPIRQGAAKGSFSLESQGAFSGNQASKSLLPAVQVSLESRTKVSIAGA